jgi:hypothetical protein
MGTSNWQNIPFVIDALMKIAPTRVLDVGIGYGRWGMIVREFCELWFDRTSRKDWRIYIEGIEAFPDNIDEYHKYFYNKIVLEDFKNVCRGLDRSWDVVIFGDVLEHFEKATGTEFLAWALDSSKYTLINIPLGKDWPQDEKYENIYERHLSIWDVEDFAPFPVIRSELFHDFTNRKFGSFILSTTDPSNLTEGLFSRNTPVDFDTEILDRLIDEIQQNISRISAIEEENRILNQEKNSFKEEIRILKGENNNLRKDLETITNTRSYKLARRISLSPLGYMAAALLKKKNVPPQRPIAPPAAVKKPGFSEEEESFIERIRKNGGPVSILNPEWRGIRSSAQELFTENYFINDTLTPETALHYSDLLTEAGCPALVIQGFPLTYRYLVEAFHAKSPRIPIFAVWHGSFLQSGEEINWTGFRSIVNYCRRGMIYKLGFVKKGMAEVVGKMGIRTGFVMNFVRDIPEGPSKTKNDGLCRIGIWNIKPDWRKQPYAMIAAASTLDNVELHISGADHRTMEMAELLKVKARITPDAVPQDQIRRRLAEMDVNLYVTLSECAPMLPLESLSAGSPCLIGPTSHYFEDADYLHSRLVVPYPDKAFVIAEYTKQALEERDRIVHEYIPYARQYNEKARESLKRFMEMSRV